ncbi:hypothetical protein BDZ89DRAFT_1051193 [Hymenopellis radicata]|nr:hypothetical protein BDZ89DRAFT_1051193 [Hymenopellis radicata]
MPYELEYIWQREKPYTHVPNFLVLYRAYRDNYVEFAGKDFHSLTSKQQKHWDNLGGTHQGVGSSAEGSVSGAWGIPPLRAVPKEKTPRTRRAKPYDRKMWKPVVRARAARRQAERSQSQPPVIIPPPRRILYSVSAPESVSKGGEGERKGSASDRGC